MYCKNLLIRKKNYKPYLYCKEFRKEITLDECKKCSKTILKRNKPIRKISKKRIVVTKETYEQVFNRDKSRCRLADANCNGRLELHHILYRSEAKELINEPSNCIMLCTTHHKLVHSNKHLWQPILKEMVKSD